MYMTVLLGCFDMIECVCSIKVTQGIMKLCAGGNKTIIT